MTETTAKDLVDIDQEARIMQAAADGSNARWVIGDEVLKSKVKALLCHVPLIELYAHIADLSGIGSWETVRKLAELAAFYPANMRDDYPILYASHFRAAKRTGSLEVACQWLNLAQSSADHYAGKPMPVRVLQAKISAAIASGVIIPIDNSDDPFEILLQAMMWKAKSFRKSFEVLLDQANASGSESLLQAADGIAFGLDMIEAEFDTFRDEQAKLQQEPVCSACGGSGTMKGNDNYLCPLCSSPAAKDPCHICGDTGIMPELDGSPMPCVCQDKEVEFENGSKVVAQNRPVKGKGAS